MIALFEKSNGFNLLKECSTTKKGHITWLRPCELWGLFYVPLQIVVLFINNRWIMDSFAINRLINDVTRILTKSTCFSRWHDFLNIHIYFEQFAMEQWNSELRNVNRQKWTYQ